jgi:hypothetical protein
MFASAPLFPSFWQGNVAASSGMQPPLTQRRPEGQLEPASEVVQGATQRPSTHTLPPWQEAVLEQAGDGATSHTLRLKSQA